MTCSSGSTAAVSRLAVAWGLLALATVLTAFVTSGWLWTWEPLNSAATATVTFRIGLWHVCPTVWRDNSSQHNPVASPACSLVKYSSWDEVKHSDLGLWAPLHFTPIFVTRMRLSMPFEAVGLLLILIATLFAVMGHCSCDHKMLIACGLYILGGLSLGGGLVVFASVLSDAYLERPRGTQQAALFDYRYGWSFFVACASFLMSELAALLSVTAYLRRFPSVEEMVSAAVPGAERLVRNLWTSPRGLYAKRPLLLPATLASAAVTVPIKLMGPQQKAPERLEDPAAAGAQPSATATPTPTPFLFAEQLQQQFGGQSFRPGRYETLRPPTKKKAVNCYPFENTISAAGEEIWKKLLF
ncbi:voltage-dependent calcium channel gamma-7 subunit-like [Schistocerca piceifrons]|uniref:voltage-dependent calcium channel gamma-7 subunit-like n=1 Tax=Schistocerca piceifrons TaxID=274613 RepID=UPI001F5FA0F7|nr:voltage-dependent calcium channel gamma-7 subunit-like [Schistocerca piceifrons]